MDCFLTRKDPCLQINPTHLNSNSMTCAASFGSNQGLRAMTSQAFEILRSESSPEVRACIERISTTPVTETDLQNSSSLQEAMKIPKTVMAQIHQIAKAHYTREQWEHARSLFMMLTVLAPMEPAYCMGLGASYQHMGDMEGALRCYTTGSILDPTHPLPFLLASECCRSVGHVDQAVQLLEGGQAHIKEYPSPDPLWVSLADELQAELIKKVA